MIMPYFADMGSICTVQYTSG